MQEIINQISPYHKSYYNKKGARKLPYEYTIGLSSKCSGSSELTQLVNNVFTLSRVSSSSDQHANFISSSCNFLSKENLKLLKQLKNI